MLSEYETLARQIPMIIKVDVVAAPDPNAMCPSLLEFDVTIKKLMQREACFRPEEVLVSLYMLREAPSSVARAQLQLSQTGRNAKRNKSAS